MEAPLILGNLDILKARHHYRSGTLLDAGHVKKEIKSVKEKLEEESYASGIIFKDDAKTYMHNSSCNCLYCTVLIKDQKIMNSGKISLYANLKHQQNDVMNQICSRFMTSNLDIIVDTENENDQLQCFHLNISEETVEGVIDTMIRHLTDMLDLAKRDETVLPKGSYSRIVVELYEEELIPEKINFTENPHAEHIHIFNKDAQGFIRVKHSNVTLLIAKTIETLTRIKDDI